MKKLLLLISGLCLFLLIGCNQDNDQSAPPQNDTQNDTQTDNQTAKPDLNNEELSVSFNDAIDEFKKKYADASITKIELDSDLKEWKYEITGVDDTTEYEAEINANTKELTNTGEEALDQDEKNTEKETNALDIDNVILPDKAIESVLNETEGEIDGWTLEIEDGRTIYEVTVRNGNKDIDYIVDAMNGELLGTDK